MKRVFTFFLATILILSLVYAENSASVNSQQSIITSQQNQIQDEAMSNTKEKIQEIRRLTEEKIENLREKMQEKEEVLLEKKNITLKRINDKVMEMKEKRIIVQTKLNLASEGNGSQIKIKLSNGRNAEIKIMPEVASERALERLRLKNCDGNCTIELKEVGQENKTRAVYEARVQKEFKLFGIVRRNREVLTQIDAETGEEVLTRRPWWSFLASEE